MAKPYRIIIAGIALLGLGAVNWNLVDWLGLKEFSVGAVILYSLWCLISGAVLTVYAMRFIGDE